MTEQARPIRAAVSGDAQGGTTGGGAVMEEQKNSVHPARKRRVLDYVRACPEQAVSIATAGRVKLIKPCGDGVFESGNLYGICGASSTKGNTFRLYLNEKTTRAPGFACGEYRGSFIHLVELEQGLDEEEAWEFCQRNFPLDEAKTGNKAVQWTREETAKKYREGMAYHERNKDQMREKFTRHVARLSDERRLAYPATENGSAILAAYCNSDGKAMAVEEREIEPGLNGEARKFTRWHIGKGVHPRLTEPSGNDTVLITVGAWEADQLREHGADVYAVLSERCTVPDDVFLYLAARYSRFVFIGSAGKGGRNWATKCGVAQCQKRGLSAEAFEWPAGVPNGYSICRLIRDGGKVRVDSDGGIEVFCPSSVLEPGLRKLTEKEDSKRKAYVMVSTLILESPLLSDEAKLIYAQLLSRQDETGGKEAFADHIRLRRVVRAGEKKIKKAIQELRNFSLLISQERRGYYHVATRKEILPAVEEKLFDSITELDGQLRAERRTTKARILDMGDSSKRQECVPTPAHEAGSLF